MSENSTAVISSKSPYPVRIGALLLYCEKFSAEGSRSFSEKATVSGGTFFSNTNKKALRITLEGRVYDDVIPMRPLLYADNMMTSIVSFNIEYRGASFTDCYIQSFSVSDKGEDFVHASITLVTAQPSQTSEV